MLGSVNRDEFDYINWGARYGGGVTSNPMTEEPNTRF
jgi:hypothetical protein